MSVRKSSFKSQAQVFEPLIQFFKTLEGQKDALKEKEKVKQAEEEDKNAIFDISFKEKALD